MTDAAVQHIDIQTDKIIDWCVNRGQLSADWVLSLKSVQAKVKSALANPALAIPLDVQRHMEEQGLTYWSCLSGLQMQSESLLRSRGHAPTDVGKLKNFFGRYTDAPLKALWALVLLYQSGRLYLAEGAHLLSQRVKYDIPQLRRLVASNLKQNEDLLRKISEEAKSARDMKKKIAQQLEANWRITTTTDLHRQLQRRAEEDVPALLNAVITASKEAKFGEAMEYYREFVRYCLKSDSSAPAPFPTLEAVRAADLLSVTATKEESDDAAVAASSAAGDAAAADGGIDWGISVESSGDGAAAAATGAIDWGITSEGGGEAAPAAAAGGINWGDDDDAAAAAPAAIDWGIETTESGSGADAASPSASGSAAAAAAAGASSPSPCAAASSSPHSDLSLDATRHAFLGELLELESFLSERVHDLALVDDLAAAAFQGPAVPHVLTLQSQQTAQNYLAAVRSVLQQLRSPRLTQLLMVRTSKRYVDRVVSGIKQQLSSVERLERAQVEHESRRGELARITSRSSHELATLVAQCRTLKSHMEAEISKLFQNRPVHIVGEINQILQ